MSATAVKKEWAGVDVTGFDPYKKALQMRLIDLIWNDENSRERLSPTRKPCLNGNRA